MKLPEKWQKVVEQNSEYIVQSVLGENEKEQCMKNFNNICQNIYEWQIGI